jgi:hypothetical protein
MFKDEGQPLAVREPSNVRMCRYVTTGMLTLSGLTTTTTITTKFISH